MGFALIWLLWWRETQTCKLTKSVCYGETVIDVEGKFYCVKSREHFANEVAFRWVSEKRKEPSSSFRQGTVYQQLRSLDEMCKMGRGENLRSSNEREREPSHEGLLCDTQNLDVKLAHWNF